ncbi:MAG: phage major tail protein, TP901-1 family [Pseudomonadota bacterium]
MSAKPGKDILLKIGNGAVPQSFTTVAGLRTKSLSLNAASVDVTHSESQGRWRELLDGAGVKAASVAGAGIFLNDAAAEAVRLAFFNGEIGDWQVIIPGLGEIEGAFQIVNLDYAGDHDGEATVSLALASAGALTFTADQGGT